MDAYSRRAVVFLLLLFIFTGFVVKVERSMLGSILPPQSASSPDKSDSADKSWASDSIWQRLFGSAPAVVETRGLQKPSSPAFNDPADIIPQAEEPTCKTLPDESHQVTTRGLPPCPSSHQDFPMWAILMIQPTKVTLAHRVSRSLIRIHHRPPETVLLFSGAATSVPEDKPWIDAFKGANDFIIYAKHRLTQAEALERALRITYGKYVVFCTGDRQVAHVTTEWLQRARALFEQNPRLGLIGSQAGRIEGEVVQADAVRTQNGLFFVGEVAGGPVVIRRAALLNERVLSMGPDTCGVGASCLDGAVGLSWRVWSAGFQVGILAGEAPSSSSVRRAPADFACLSTLDHPTRTAAYRLAAAANAEALRDTTAPLPPPAACGTVPLVCRRSVVAERPIHGAIIQYFHRAEFIPTIAEAPAYRHDHVEMLVNNDSRSEMAEWLAALPESGFVVLSPDIHEIRGYNRLGRLSSAMYLGLMQDDDAPQGTVYVDAVPALFEKFPDLRLIGGFRGRMDTGEKIEENTNQVMGEKYGPEFIEIPSVEPKTGRQFMFMYKVNAAPLFLHRDHFLESGGFNRNFSCPGMSGIDFDFEFSIRTWWEGYQVGLLDAGFDHGAMNHEDKTGTRKNSESWRLRKEQEKRNNEEIYEMYPGFHPRVGTQLAKAAAVLVEPGGTVGDPAEGANRWLPEAAMSKAAAKRERQRRDREEKSVLAMQQRRLANPKVYHDDGSGYNLRHRGPSWLGADADMAPRVDDEPEVRDQAHQHRVPGGVPLRFGHAGASTTAGGAGEGEGGAAAGGGAAGGAGGTAQSGGGSEAGGAAAAAAAGLIDDGGEEGESGGESSSAGQLLGTLHLSALSVRGRRLLLA